MIISYYFQSREKRESEREEVRGYLQKIEQDLNEHPESFSTQVYGPVVRDALGRFEQSNPRRLRRRVDRAIERFREDIRELLRHYG